MVCGGLRDVPGYAVMLRATGYDVVISNSYEEGARRLATEDFDFAIVNQGSAAFEGRRILEQAMALDRRVPVLVVTRSVNMHNYLEAMELGAVDYLERPKPEDVGWVLETQMRRPCNFVVNDQQDRLDA